MKTLLAIFLCALILLAACAPDALSPAAPGAVTDPPEPGTVTEPPAPAPSSDGRFTLRYNPDAPLNPLTSDDPDNLLLAPLLYESLFTLDEGFRAVPLLCDEYETEDNVTYTFHIKPDVAMSDGSALGADDVSYSLLQARAGRFAQRLRAVTDVEVADSLTVTVTLASANTRLPELLDIPVIKYGSTGTIPLGSGPYVYSGADAPRLIKAQNHRDADRLPLDTIWLLTCTDAELAELFTSQAADLYVDDPAGASAINVRRDHEARYYNTTVMHFLGFNTRREALRDSQIRRALGLAADGRTIVGSIMLGHALPAPLALSPAYRLYDAAWEQSPGDPLVEMSAIFSRAGMTDANSDSYLEYMSQTGEYVPFSIDFIVNAENEYKVAAAEQIAETIRRVGVQITLRRLPWESYTIALESGDFDMYYGETRLPADFDLSALIAPGGALDYGGVGLEEYGPYLSDFRAAIGDAAETAAAFALCRKIQSDAPFIPILYKQYAVHTGRGVVSGLAPTQSGVFIGVADWRVNNL
ncbi:MAG: ABC transporter substrate-binding protein [Oscillospiraceae bacterium]|jgi:peptide/nickel transport system substrate-binding protein|nr:ABC transporter substrate-binding protein [Oscillospiraceae bacterium]